MKNITIITTTFVLTVVLQNAHATLVDGSTLSFSAAFGGHNNSDTSQPAVGTGSWWAFPDVSIYLGIESFNGLIVGTSQLASGSHVGAPDGTESPAIDKAWQAFASTGMLESTSPTSIVGASGNTATLDFSGISVDWNGIDAIPLHDPIGFPADTGLAFITCVIDCGLGDTYILDYAGHTTMTQTGKDGVPFLIHLEGTITAVPLPATAWLFGSGLLGLVGMARCKKTA